MTIIHILQSRLDRERVLNLKAVVQKPFLAALAFVSGAIIMRGFYSAARQYSSFAIPYGVGVNNITVEELAFYLWFGLYGMWAAVGFSIGFSLTGIPEWIEKRVWPLFKKPRFLLAVLGVSCFAGVVSFRRFVLLHSPVADDESVYVFIAKTLLEGRIINPLPPDPSFYANQFIVINKIGWFGMYPIGYPLLLAAGEYFHLQWLPNACLAVLSLLFTFLIGRRLFGNTATCMALCLLSLSPHFIGTSATLLSQTASTLFMLMGFWATLIVQENKRAIWALLAGAFLAFGVFIRPMPGVLFLAAVAAVFMAQKQDLSFGKHFTSHARLLVVAAIPVMVVAVLMLLINHAQTGYWFTCGYHEVFGQVVESADTTRKQLSLSVASAFLRENFWLFGWPCSYLFIVFVRGRKSLALFWALIAAEYAYRLIVPKTVVATTGPIYVTEIVPLLALATGSGILQLKRHLERLGFASAKKRVLSVVMASAAVAWIGFWPIQIRGLRESQRLGKMPYRILEQTGVKRALIFARFLVPPESRSSWAYYPPNVSPSMDDDILFVRPSSKTSDGLAKMMKFWESRYPDRPAFVLDFKEGTARLEPLKQPD